MTTLYRLYGRTGDLLYIGIADNWPSRMKQHQRDKGWWAEVGSTALVAFNTRQQAEDAERQAIKRERPKHNIVHNGTVAKPPERVALNVRNPIGIREFDHRVITLLPEYHAARKAMDKLCHAMMKLPDEAKFTQDDWIAAAGDFARSAPYSDHCERCELSDINDWIVFPSSITFKDRGGLIAAYVCPKCLHQWSCWFAIDLPAYAP